MTLLRRVFGLTAFVSCIWAVTASVHAENCRPPFPERFQAKVCSTPERRMQEQRLVGTIGALRLLLDEGPRTKADNEQSNWERDRRAACMALADEEIGPCVDRRTEQRLRDVQAAVVRELRNETLPLLDRKLELHEAARINPPTIVTQLRYRGRALAETLGRSGFKVVARRGNARSEAVALRGKTDGAIYVLVGNLGAPPEIWQYRPTPRTLGQGIIIDANATTLVIREPATEHSGQTIVQWTPNDGWQLASRPHVAELPAKPDEFDENTATVGAIGNDVNEGETVMLGTKRLKLLERVNQAPQHVLAFGPNVVVEGGPNPFDMSAPERIGDTTVMFVLAYNGGNGGCVAQYMLADTPGRPLRRWELDLCYPLSAHKTADGYLLSTSVWPYADGVRYRWTPSEGLIVDGFFPFVPKDMRLDRAENTDSGTIWFASETEQLFRALQASAGPSFPALALDFARVHKLPESTGQVALFSDCSQSGRFCGHEVTSIVAFELDTGKTFFAFAPHRPYAYRPFGTPDPEQGLVRPVEYHPPLELWPADVREVIAGVLR